MSKKLEHVKREEAESPKNWTSSMRRALVSDFPSVVGREAAAVPLNEKISLLIDAAGGRKAAASVMGVAATTVDNYRSGQTQPRFLELLRLAAAANESLEFLLNGTEFESLSVSRTGDEPALSQSLSAAPGDLPGDMIRVPKLDIRPSAGFGSLASNEDGVGDELVALRSDLLRAIGVSPRFARLMVAKGDSMAPRINDGDLIIVDVSIREVVDEGIYVLVYGGLVLLKRIQIMRSGDLLLKSDNPHYETERIKRDEQPELIIEGRVRWCGGAI